MATKRNPEERSDSAAAQNVPPAAKPTGNEVFNEATAAAGTGQAPASPEEARSHLQELAIGYYKNLSGTASELSRQASEILSVGTDVVQRNVWESVGVAAGVGLILGFIID